MEKCYSHFNVLIIYYSIVIFAYPHFFFFKYIIIFNIKMYILNTLMYFKESFGVFNLFR